jgi:hypothetical protein
MGWEGDLTIGADLCYRWGQQKQRDFASRFKEFIKNLYVSYIFAILHSSFCFWLLM